MMKTSRLLLLCALTITVVHSTTEWYGDLRAYLVPNSAFYDITYDDLLCHDTGLQSNAIPDYVYFGRLIATSVVDDHTKCLQECLQNTRCKAVNYFRPMSYQEHGYCELLSETQMDNPRLMRPFKRAVYYEYIHCRTDDIGDDYDNTLTGDKNKLTTATKHSSSSSIRDETVMLKKLSDKVSEFNHKYRHRRR